MQMAVAFAGSSLLPKIGMLAATTALTFLMSDKKKDNANKLSDLKVSSSTYGRGIPLVHGTMRCSSNMFWATDIVEEKKWIGPKGKELDDGKGEKKGKKGKAQEMYEYFGNFAMGLCEGPQSEVIRIWADSNLIYDKYNPDGEERVGFSQGDDGAGGKSGAIGKKGERAGGGRFPFRFYSGSEDQEPDPFMVQTQGASMVPAYRGLCYLMFEHFPLMDFGNRIPTITAEVVPVRERAFTLKGWIKDPEYPYYWSDTKVMIDPVNEKLYQFNIVVPSSPRVAVWDINKGVQTHSHFSSDLEWPYLTANRNGRTVVADGGGFVGLSDKGNLVVSTSGSVDHGWAAEVDPETLNFLRVYWNPDRADGQWLQLFHAFPTAWMGYSVTGGSMVHSATIGRAWTGGLYALNGFAAGRVGHVDNASAIGRSSWIQPGVINEVGTIFAGVGTKVNAVSMAGTSLVNPFLDFAPGSFYGNVQPPIWMQGVGGYLWLWRDTPTIFGGTGMSYARLTNADGEMIWEIPLTDVGYNLVGGNAEYTPIPVIRGSSFFYITGDMLVEVDCLNREVKSERLPPYVTIGLSAPQFYLESKNAIVYWGYGTPTGSSTSYQTWWVLYLGFDQVMVTDQEIIRDMCLRVGIEEDQIDFSQHTARELTGHIIENPTTARSVIEGLFQVFFADATESDNKLKFVSRGQAPIATVYEMDLADISGDTSSDRYLETRMQEIDLPQVVTVSFINSDDDYQTGTNHYRRPNSPMSVMQSREILDVNVPIAMKPDVAKKMAEQVNIASWAERITHKFSLPWKYLVYDPTDVFTFRMDSGLTFVDRLMTADVGGNYAIEVESVSQIMPRYDDPLNWTDENVHSPYDPQGTGTPSGGAVTVPTIPPPISDPVVMDTPFTEDVDAGDIGTSYPLYWGAAAREPGFIFGSFGTRDEGNDYTARGSTVVEAIHGAVIEPVPDPPNGPFATDDKSSIILRPQYDFEAVYVYEWESIPAELWPSYDNMILIGNEIILFRDVVVNADGTVTISHLIRGHRGTEQHAYGHGNNEKFVILNTAGHKMATMPSTLLDKLLDCRISGGGNFFQFASEAVTITFKANALRPYAPNHIKRTDSGGNINLSWQRRTRLNGPLKDATGTVPLNEETENYRLFICKTEVDELTFDPTNVASYARMIEQASNSFTYTAAMMAEDVVTATDTIWVVVYQMSADVTYGFPGVAKLETTVSSYKVS